MSKLPAFQFYVGDWMKDPALRSCSHAARGLWMDLLCLMHESPHRGYLEKRDSVAFSVREVARATGSGDTRLVTKLVTELQQHNVFSRTQNGVIYSRRMVRDEAVREATRKRVSEFRERDTGKFTGAKEVDRNADVTLSGNADVTAQGNGDVTPPVTAMYHPASSSSTSSSSTSSSVQEQTTPLSTLVDLSSTQAPPAGEPRESVGDFFDVSKQTNSQIVDVLFRGYCDQLKRNPAKYTLTPGRKARAIKRLYERTSIHGSVGPAVRDLEQAIQNLAKDDYLVANGLVDWDDQIFKSTEEFEKRLNRVKPNGGSSHAGSSHETREQRNQRIHDEAIASLDRESPDDDEQPAPERNAG